MPSEPQPVMCRADDSRERPARILRRLPLGHIARGSFTGTKRFVLGRVHKVAVVPSFDCLRATMIEVNYRGRKATCRQWHGSDYVFVVADAKVSLAHCIT